MPRSRAGEPLTLPTGQRHRAGPRPLRLAVKRMRLRRFPVLASAAVVVVILMVLVIRDRVRAGSQSTVAALQPIAARASEPAAALARLAAGDHPEARLAAAYEALDAGQTDAAFEIAAALVRERPDFALAQALHADLLASRAGHPMAFGANLQDNPAVPIPAPDLLDEARLRWAAVKERPRPDQVPAEFLELPASVRYAVAVDTSRSRLYLLKNGPQGLQLQSDHYVSVGKLGVGKQVEGDSRTPLGVYWMVQGVRGPMRDERLGLAALRFNYPNAWDRLRGRTGSGLYLHGVPQDVFARAPLATDGCVALANDDVKMLIDTVDVDNTPVLIAQKLTWVAPGGGQAARDGFQAAFQAWDRARQDGRREALSRWYESDAAIAPETLEAGPARESPSVIGWNGDAQPLIVTSSRGTLSAPGKSLMFRQYWTQRDGQWRIVYDGALPVRPQDEAGARRTRQL